MNISAPLPQAYPFEQMVAVAIISDPTKYADAFQYCTLEDFSYPPLRTGAGWISTMLAENARVSLWSLHQRFGNQPEWEAFKAAVTNVDGCVPAYAGDYAKGLADRAQLRRADAGLAAAAHVVSNARRFADIRPRLEEAMMEIIGVEGRNEVRHVRTVVYEIRNEMAHPQERKRSFTLGFPQMDYMTNGGIKEGQLWILAAGTGVGKTTWAMNALGHIAQQGTPAAVFSLEMSARDLTLRASLSMQEANPEEALAKVARLPLIIADNPDTTAEGIRTMTKLLVARYGCKVILADYLQLIRESGARNSNREREVAGMSRALKLAAKENEVGIIALSQTNEAGQLRESRAIEQDADLVAYILKDGEKHLLRITKNRHGARHGSRAEAESENPVRGIGLSFDAPNFRFTET